MLSAVAPPLERLVSRLAARSPLGAVERRAILGLAVSPTSIKSGQMLVQRGDAVRDVCLVAGG